MKFAHEFEVAEQMANNQNGKPPTYFIFAKKTPGCLLYADDAVLKYCDIGEILPKLQSYKEFGEPGNFTISWEKVFTPILKSDRNKYKGEISKSPNLSVISNTKQKPRYSDT